MNALAATYVRRASSATAPSSSATAPVRTTVAGYLLTRLAEAGVVSVFGVPGDDNQKLLEAIAGRPALAWVGMATEQGAGYAADSYARLRGLSAVVTTYGTGELSVLSAIAGAYAESVPVVHIVGTPALADRHPGVARRHQLPGAGFGRFAAMAAGVTAAQADLRPGTAAAEIDRVLATALRTSRPVYLAIPADVAGSPVLAPASRLPDMRWPGNAAQASPIPARPGGAGRRATEGARARTGRRLTPPLLWSRLQCFLLPGDLVVADQGVLPDGAAGLSLPGGAQLISQPLWASAGWTLLATLGASLAAADRRVVVIIGDRAMRQAAPELGTLLGQGLAPVIIVLSHRGAAAAPEFHRPDAGSLRLPTWDWTALPAALGAAARPLAIRAASPRQLTGALRSASRHAGRTILIEAVLGLDEAPARHQDLGRLLAATGGYSRS